MVALRVDDHLGAKRHDLRAVTGAGELQDASRRFIGIDWIEPATENLHAITETRQAVLHKERSAAATDRRLPPAAHRAVNGTLPPGNPARASPTSPVSDSSSQRAHRSRAGATRESTRLR